MCSFCWCPSSEKNKWIFFLKQNLILEIYKGGGKVRKTLCLSTAGQFDELFKMIFFLSNQFHGHTWWHFIPATWLSKVHLKCRSLMMNPCIVKFLFVTHPQPKVRLGMFNELIIHTNKFCGNELGFRWNVIHIFLSWCHNWGFLENNYCCPFNYLKDCMMLFLCPDSLKHVPFKICMPIWRQWWEIKE